VACASLQAPVGLRDDRHLASSRVQALWRGSSVSVARGPEDRAAQPSLAALVAPALGFFLHPCERDSHGRNTAVLTHGWAFTSYHVSARDRSRLSSTPLANQRVGRDTL
jgi:hypothetical protein